ncbi:MAG TPA: hypothetical protein VJ300_02605 [Thermoplasmata archaeon]|nr:hypothetical protein [Thermoplasmata archaeon]
MIPVPPGPGDILPTPEGSRPLRGGGESMPLVLQAMDEIDALKRNLADLLKRLESVEGRVAALESRRSA